MTSPSSRAALAALLLLFATPGLAGDIPVDVESVLSVFDEEPTVLVVQGWAVGVAELHPERARRLVADARARGALPLVRVRGRFEDSAGTKWDELNLMDSRDEDTDYTLDLWLEWDLAELASGPDMLRAVREGRELIELRQAVVNQVNMAYFDRRRLMAEQVLAHPEEPLERALVRRLRLQELDATLDGLTGGRWSEALVPPVPDPPLENRDLVATESEREPTGEGPDPGLRVPVHPADRAPSP